MLSIPTAGCQCASGKRIGWEGWTRASLSKVICQSFSIAKVAFAASWTHKHDGANTPKVFKVIIVVVGSGAYPQ